MRLSERELRDRYSEWIAVNMGDCDELAFLTCTLRQGIKHPWGWVRLSEEDADSALTVFLKKLDQHVYGTAGSKRYSRYLRSADVMEGNDGKVDRLHRHLLIEVPTSRITFERFANLIECTWPKIHWGYKVLKIERCENVHAVSQYIVKTGGSALRLRTTRF